MTCGPQMTRREAPLIPSMRTPGGGVISGRWGRSLSGGSLTEAFAANSVAVLVCCMVLALVVMGRDPTPGSKAWRGNRRDGSPSLHLQTARAVGISPRSDALRGPYSKRPGLATRSVGSSWGTTWRVDHVSGWKIVPGSPPGATRKRRPDQPTAALLLHRAAFSNRSLAAGTPGMG
jgi:hypothetical protein